jgi:hypothetical protein
MTLDLECEELIVEMFPIFYVASEAHPKYMVTQFKIL